MILKITASIPKYGISQGYNGKKPDWKTPTLAMKDLAQTSDIFVSTQKISFKASEYNRNDAEQFIDKIAKKEITTNTRGFQGEFFKFGEKYGIKSVNPLDINSPFADLKGENNIKEYYILNQIKNISPDIAVAPIDLIEKDNKYFLVMKYIDGVHPFDSSLNKEQVKDIVKKLHKLDINGIVHSDLQSGNIFLTNNSQAKLIDFGSYSILDNSGKYIPSDSIPTIEYTNGNISKYNNSALESKFLATFYNKTIPTDIKNYSDNRYLNIKSNISNFEFRTLYDYLHHNKAENPQKFFSEYLKIKAENYHKPMTEFLEKLEISPNDIEQITQRNNTVQTEKMFYEVFSNPTENILKSELSKIELKWLINDYQGGKSKAFEYFNRFLKNIDSYTHSAVGIEKQYFDEMKHLLAQYRNFLDNDQYKGQSLTNAESIIGKIFNKEKTTSIVETAKNIKPNEKQISTNNKYIKLIVAIISASSIFGILYSIISKKGIKSTQEKFINQPPTN